MSVPKSRCKDKVCDKPRACNPLTGRCKKGLIKPATMDIFDNIDWSMQRRVVKHAASTNKKHNVPWYDEVRLHKPSRKLKKEEWDIIVHPDSSWVLVWDFDERAIPDIEGVDLEVDTAIFKGEIRFSKRATVKDVLSAIAALPVRYGFFEGIVLMDKNKYALQWGT